MFQVKRSCHNQSPVKNDGLGRYPTLGAAMAVAGAYLAPMVEQQIPGWVAVSTDDQIEIAKLYSWPGLVPFSEFPHAQKEKEAA